MRPRVRAHRYCREISWLSTAHIQYTFDSELGSPGQCTIALWSGTEMSIQPLAPLEDFVLLFSTADELAWNPSCAIRFPPVTLASCLTRATSEKSSRHGRCCMVLHSGKLRSPEPNLAINALSISIVKLIQVFCPS